MTKARPGCGTSIPCRRPSPERCCEFRTPLGDHGISRHVGDLVTADQTVVAVMQPMAPGFIDARSREELEAAVASADAAVKQAEADIRRLQAALDFSRNELQRAQALARTQTISTQAFDKAKFGVETSEAALISA